MTLLYFFVLPRVLKPKSPGVIKKSSSHTGRMAGALYDINPKKEVKMSSVTTNTFLQIEGW